MPFCQLRLMGILPNSAFKEKIHLQAGKSHTLQKISFIRNTDEFWTSLPDSSQPVQTKVGKEVIFMGAFQTP